MNNIPVERQRMGFKDELITSLPYLLDPASAVESIVTAALRTSAQKMGLDDVEVFVTRLKQGDHTAFDYYRYDVARELGAVVGSWSGNIRAVYACNYDEGIDAEDCLEHTSKFPLIHMIIWAEQKNKALDALIEALDGATVQRHRRLLGLDQLKHVLDVQIIDDEDVANRTGYAALLRSIHQPPIQVWQSTPGI